MATYLAEMWKTQLVVFTALDGTKIKPEVQDYVKRYLEIHEVEADYILTDSDSKSSIKNMITEQQVDLILLGSYGGSAIRGVVVGSTVDFILREVKVPAFICR